MKMTYLIIAHGSREKKFEAEFLNFLSRFQSHFPGRKVRHAFLDISLPNIPQALESCITDGDDEIVIIPLMIFTGKHIKEDIPNMIQQAKAKHPHVHFHYTGPLADSDVLIYLVEDKIKEVPVKV